jgi:hypothetical protein
MAGMNQDVHSHATLLLELVQSLKRVQTKGDLALTLTDGYTVLKVLMRDGRQERNRHRRIVAIWSNVSRSVQLSCNYRRSTPVNRGSQRIAQ